MSSVLFNLFFLGLTLTVFSQGKKISITGSYVLSSLATVIIAINNCCIAEVIQFPDNSTIHLGQNGTFQCISINATVLWRVVGSNVNPSDAIIIDTELIDTGLIEVQTGIFVSLTSVDNIHTSEMIIAGDQRNNFTKIQCVAKKLRTTYSNASVAVLRLFGKI